MTIEITDGWPYVQPELVVDGLPPLEHVNEGNVVCLWRTGDPARQWKTLGGWRERIAQWCDGQTSGFRRLDEVTDTHAYFRGEVHALARMDLGAIPTATPDGEQGHLRGRWRHNQSILDLRVDKTSGQDVKGAWFFREAIAAPPRTLDEVRDTLVSGQNARLAELVESAKGGKPRIVMLLWDTPHGRNALVLHLDRDPESVVQRPVRGRGAKAPAARVRTRPLELAPSQVAVLRQRAGRDAERLERCSVVVFGGGAIGSHIALMVARCGVGKLTVVDGEPLRPGNVVRHIAGEEMVGWPKPVAIAKVVDGYAPWTTVAAIQASPWDPRWIRDRVEDHDLAVDTTGSASFADQLGVLGLDAETPLVTATLYRRGEVARIRRQAPGDIPLHMRADSARYPQIPHPPMPEPILLEPGCSAPVNEAPPHFVAACAALATEVVIDALSLPLRLPDEVIEVYRPLESEPFDEVGRIDRAS
jgi:hypothetical protein